MHARAQGWVARTDVIIYYENLKVTDDPALLLCELDVTLARNEKEIKAK